MPSAMNAMPSAGDISPVKLKIKKMNPSMRKTCPVDFIVSTLSCFAVFSVVLKYTAGP